MEESSQHLPRMAALRACKSCNTRAPSRRPQGTSKRWSPLAPGLPTDLLTYLLTTTPLQPTNYSAPPTPPPPSLPLMPFPLLRRQSDVKVTPSAPPTLSSSLSHTLTTSVLPFPGIPLHGPIHHHHHLAVNLLLLAPIIIIIIIIRIRIRIRAPPQKKKL